jgi:hypothetical protein
VPIDGHHGFPVAAALALSLGLLVTVGAGAAHYATTEPPTH